MTVFDIIQWAAEISACPLCHYYVIHCYCFLFSRQYFVHLFSSVSPFLFFHFQEKETQLLSYKWGETIWQNESSGAGSIQSSLATPPVWSKWKTSTRQHSCSSFLRVPGGNLHEANVIRNPETMVTIAVEDGSNVSRNSSSTKIMLVTTSLHSRSRSIPSSTARVRPIHPKIRLSEPCVFSWVFSFSGSTHRKSNFFSFEIAGMILTALLGRTRRLRVCLLSNCGFSTTDSFHHVFRTWWWIPLNASRTGQVYTHPILSDTSIKTPKAGTMLRWRAVVACAYYMNNEDLTICPEFFPPESLREVVSFLRSEIDPDSPGHYVDDFHVSEGSNPNWHRSLKRNLPKRIYDESRGSQAKVDITPLGLSTAPPFTVEGIQRNLGRKPGLRKGQNLSTNFSARRGNLSKLISQCDVLEFL